jgi:RNA polymerase sigma factor (sigma-70 family)
LKKKERHVIIGRFFEDKTFQEIGKELNLSRQRVHIIQKFALDKLRGMFFAKKENCEI